MELKYAKELLSQERSELADLAERVGESSGLAESQEESTGELTNFDQHLGDHATDTFEREKDRSISEGIDAKLSEIDAALERIDRGEYGVCEVCGRKIADERLEAVPATRFCREHADTSSAVGAGNGGGVEVTQELEG